MLRVKTSNHFLVRGRFFLIFRNGDFGKILLRERSPLSVERTISKLETVATTSMVKKYLVSREYWYPENIGSSEWARTTDLGIMSATL
jgi:hypothetical protein